MLIMFC